MENFCDLYTDYLISSTSLATATGMAELLTISHDKITRQLSTGVYDSKYLWKMVKPYIEELSWGTEPIILSIDDSIEAKPYTDESELVCWHWDHTFQRSVKGVNFITALTEVKGMRLPCAVEFVKKDTWVANPKNGKMKRSSSKTKNEIFRQMTTQCRQNFMFNYLACDSWFASAENMKHVKQDLETNFVMAVKSNRKVALSLEDKQNNKYVSIETLQPGQQPVEIWLEHLPFPLLLAKQVFKNEDDTVGELYLVCSDLNLTYEQITMIYKKRWGIEEYHKSIKSNLGFAKSPTKTIKTQTNHFVLSILAYVKLEWLKQRTNQNHFAMKARIYQAAMKAAYDELQTLSTKRNAA